MLRTLIEPCRGSRSRSCTFWRVPDSLPLARAFRLAPTRREHDREQRGDDDHAHAIIVTSRLAPRVVAV
jgi:hypothetical protein